MWRLGVGKCVKVYLSVWCGGGGAKCVKGVFEGVGAEGVGAKCVKGVFEGVGAEGLGLSV